MLFAMPLLPTDMTFSDKKSARAYLRQKRSALTKEYLKQASDSLCGAIIALDEFKNSDTILLFYPLGNEPDLLKVMDSATRLGKKVAFPISFPETSTLEFHEVASLSKMSVGTYGIAEPPADAPIPPLTKNTLCIVPALAVDRRGYRIGYGKGYYDRFLACFDGISLCAVFDGFLCRSLPTEATDIPLDILITETGVIRKQ